MLDEQITDTLPNRSTAHARVQQAKRGTALYKGLKQNTPKPTYGPKNLMHLKPTSALRPKGGCARRASSGPARPLGQ